MSWNPRNVPILMGRRRAVAMSVVVRIIAAAVAAFIVSTVWYMAFAGLITDLRGARSSAASEMRVPAWLMLAELGRNLVVAAVLGHLAAKVNACGLRCAMGFALCIWIGFPSMILVGSIVWENVPWALAAIHAGDWLVKLLLMSGILIPGSQRSGSNEPATPATA